MIRTTLIVLAHALYFTLPGNSKRCIDQTLSPGESLSGQFMISGTSEELVFTRLLSPDGKIIYKNPLGKSEGSFSIDHPEPGTHHLCFQSFDRASKSVSFSLKTTDSQSSGVLGAEIDPLFAAITKLAAHTDRALITIRFYQRRERVHRDLTEATCDRVLYTALAKVAALFAVSVVEVYILLRGFQSSGGKI